LTRKQNKITTQRLNLEEMLTMHNDNDNDTV